MANVSTQIVYDGGAKTVLKIVGNAGAANTVNTTVLISNTLFGAVNSGGKICLLTLSKAYHTCAMTGNVQLEWVSSVNTNAPMLMFGGSSSGVLDAVEIPNNANTPTGDVNLNYKGQANDVFTIVLTFNKDTSVYGAPYAGAWANVYAGY